MSNNVFANDRELACKAGEGKSICSFPDVCFTPPENPATPPGVPVPYPNTGLASDTTDGSRTVTISGKEVMLKNKSYFKKSTGDEAGCAAKKGVITSTNRGKVYFVAWSMDVKFEGENVVRHLDMTTHNHASPIANAAVPWPFADSAATKPGGACNTAPNDYAKQVNKSCSKPAIEDFSAECCSARKCMLVPGSLKPNHCCTRSGDQMTPHHIIPVMDHYKTEGSRKLTDPAKKKKDLIDGCKRYDEDCAPAICVSGSDHGKMEGRNRHKQHGRIGRAYVFMRDALVGDTYKYDDVREPTADMVAHHTKCDRDCILAQMDQYHGKVSRGDLRKSKNPRERGEAYYEEAVPDDSIYFQTI
jgi:hypothetical protein